MAIAPIKILFFLDSVKNKIDTGFCKGNIHHGLTDIMQLHNSEQTLVLISLEENHKKLVFHRVQKIMKKELNASKLWR